MTDLTKIDAWHPIETLPEFNEELNITFWFPEIKEQTIFHSYAAAEQAVIDRWDSPKWKDEAPTAEYINRLRVAVNSATGRKI